MVDHILPINNGGARDDESNLQTLCNRCHAIKRSRESRQGRFKIPTTVVCGAAGSGKTTYVIERMVKGDIMIDVDALLCAIGGMKWYHEAEELVPFACEARDALIKRLYQSNNASRAWIITSGADLIDREQYKKAGAKVVLLLVDADKCLERIKQDSRRKNTNMIKWQQIIQDWWRVYNLTLHTEQLDSCQ